MKPPPSQSAPNKTAGKTSEDASVNGLIARVVKILKVGIETEFRNNLNQYDAVSFRYDSLHNKMYVYM